MSGRLVKTVWKPSSSACPARNEPGSVMATKREPSWPVGVEEGLHHHQRLDRRAGLRGDDEQRAVDRDRADGGRVGGVEHLERPAEGAGEDQRREARAAHAAEDGALAARGGQPAAHCSSRGRDRASPRPPAASRSSGRSRRRAPRRRTRGRRRPRTAGGRRRRPRARRAPPRRAAATSPSRARRSGIAARHLAHGGDDGLRRDAELARHDLARRRGAVAVEAHALAARPDEAAATRRWCPPRSTRAP